MTRKRLFYQWLLRGGIGASLIGAGICCTIEVAFAKHAGAEFFHWFTLGTLSLAILVAGVCVMIDALRFKIKMEETEDLQ